MKKIYIVTDTDLHQESIGTYVFPCPYTNEDEAVQAAINEVKTRMDENFGFGNDILKDIKTALFNSSFAEYKGRAYEIFCLNMPEEQVGSKEDLLKKIHSYLTDEEINNLFVNGIEMGIGYWCDETPFIPTDDVDEEKDLYYAERLWPHVQKGESFRFGSNEYEEYGEINLASVAKACELFTTKYSSHYADIKNENDDVITADVFIQLCVFGDVVYG